MTHQNISGNTQRRVRGNTGECVGATALDGQSQFTGRHRFAPSFVYQRQHLAESFDTLFNRNPRTTNFLNCVSAECLGVCQPAFFHHPLNLHGFATQTYHHHPTEVRVTGVAIECATQRFVSFTIRTHTAAGLMCESHDAINIGVLLKLTRKGEVLGDCASDSRRAVYRSENADVVTRSHLAISATITLEGSPLRFGYIVSGDCISTETIILLEITHHTVVRMDVITGSDIGAGETNYLAIFPDSLTFSNRHQCNFMHRRNISTQGEVVFDQGDACG